MATAETPPPSASAPAPNALEARVFVGGLPADATAAELRDRFARFVSADGACSASLALELVPSKAPWASPGQHRGVAFLALTGAGAGDARDRLVKTFHRTKWRGSVLRVEPARPHYLGRLALEWQAQKDRGVDAKAAAKASVTAAEASDKPLRVAAKFAGKRRTTFEEVERREQVLEPLEDQEEEEEEEGSTSQDESEEEEEEENEGVRDASSSQEEVESDGEDGEAVGEDDVEQFVRRMEAEAAALQAPTANGEDGEEAARAEANARRVAALAARQQLRQQKEEQQRQLVAAAVSTGVKSKRITFDDDGEALAHGDNEEELEEGTGDAGRLVTDWMDSDSDGEGEGLVAEKVKAMDPEDRERLALSLVGDKSTLDFFTAKDKQQQAVEGDSEVAKAFALRPEFLGESGKRLFEMQKRFGGDQRFRLDARFMEDDEFAAGHDDILDDVASAEDVGELQTFLGEDGRDDAAARELAWQEEQDAALAVIEKLFPDLDVAKIKHRMRVQATKDPIKEASWMGRMKRYDPRDASSRREFELSKESTSGRQSREDEDVEEDDAARRKAERESKPVLVGGDRFFATSSSLGSLFTRVRKNSEDGMEGEAALDGVFGFGNKAVSAEADSEAGGAAAFKLSSLFAFPVEDEKEIAALGESLLEQDDEPEGDVHKEPWHFAQAFQDGDDAPEAEDDVETDSEGEDEDAVKENSKRRAKNKRSLEDFLAFGRTFRRPEGGGDDGKTWAERRKRLTLDFKRKRRDALKTRKKQQQQFAKHKKPRRT